ncbi:MAG TPA: thiamine pyrophosphate-binding protein [Dehalococcoidia bacterium]|nr:thiamine pyrophosphate-binding protein [Dehalococcoidia bacterium]
MTAEPLLNEEVSVGEAIVRVLEQAGIDAVFGMPGGGMGGSIFNALYDHQQRIRTVLAREEGLATVMAEAYGRLTGRPGVCSGQAAFLLTNAGMGILEGFLAGSPMLLLTDLSDGAPFSHHASYQAGTADYGTWDARTVIGGYTKQVFVAQDGPQAVQQTQLAIKHATAGTPGPVALLYHSGALGRRVGPESTPRLYASAPYLRARGAPAPEAAIGEGVATLRTSQRPVIIAGNGVRAGHARDALRELAELLDAPVATTASGKGVFPETHPLALGLFGTFGLEAANEVVAGADLVLAVGTRLGATDTARENPDLLDPTRQTFIQIEVEPKHASWTFPAEVALVGDADTVLRQLSAALRDAGFQPRSSGRRIAAEAHGRFDSFSVAESASNETPILPQRLIAELQAALPDDAIVACDAGENRLFMQHYFRTKAGMEYLQPGAVGGMGYAIPAALAARVVHPRRAVVAVCGDGGFGIAMNGLLTAVEERLPIVTVVLNNGALGWVLHGQGERPIASSFGAFDHAAIARAMGCEGIRVERPAEIAPALSQALQASRPVVVEVLTSLKQTFQQVTSPLAAQPRRARAAAR